MVQSEEDEFKTYVLKTVLQLLLKKQETTPLKDPDRFWGHASVMKTNF